jgi:hypothetical protein
MDGLIGPIRDAIHRRRYGLKNEHTNRLLLLMQLHTNRQDDEVATPRASERGSNPTTAAQVFDGEPSPTGRARGLCVDLSQVAP